MSHEQGCCPNMGSQMGEILMGPFICSCGLLGISTLWSSADRATAAAVANILSQPNQTQTL